MATSEPAISTILTDVIGIAGTEQFFALQARASPWVAVLAGLVEFGGGLLLALGPVTRVAAALVMSLMTVAMIQVRLPNGFFWAEGGYEYPLLWGILALSSSSVAAADSRSMP